MTKTGIASDVDEELVRKLARLLKETGLSEIEYGMDGWHVRVSHNGTLEHASNVGNAIAVKSPTTMPPPANATETEADDLVEHPGLVMSPMVGVVFTVPEPAAAPFVQLGDSVEPGDTLLLIEAMKVYNSIPAPHAGRVARILIANGAPVEYGEPLMIIE